MTVDLPSKSIFLDSQEDITWWFHLSMQNYQLLSSNEWNRESVRPSKFILLAQRYYSFCNLAIGCTTKELKCLNIRLQECLREIYMLSNKVLQESLDEIRPSMSKLHSVAESIAILDMILRYEKKFTIAIQTLTDLFYHSFTNTIALSPPDKPCMWDAFIVQLISPN